MAQGPTKTSSSVQRKAAREAKLGPPTTDGNAMQSLELTFGAQSTDQLHLQLGGRQAVARDDGRDGDRQARDGVFTTRVDREQAQRFEKFAAASGRDSQQFDGRAHAKTTAGSGERCETPPLPPTGLSRQEEQRLIRRS